MDRLAKALHGKRLVVKIGSALLVEPGGMVREAWLDGLARDIAGLRARGQQVVVVTSGAVALGRGRLGLPQRALRLEEKQAAAAAGQIVLARAWQESLAKIGLGTAQILITLDDTEARRRYLNARATVETLLKLGVVPVVNENDTVATSEIRFGDNDRLSARVAVMALADTLVLLSDVDGLYDGPPDRGGSRLIREVGSSRDLESVVIGGTGAAGVGLGGMGTKVDAARIATEAGIPVVLTAAPLAARALAGDEVGTFFHATGDRSTSRLLWLAHASASQGQLHLDAGAVRALLHRGASLLPAGITHVVGGFVARDPVDLLGPDGTLLGRGLVAYDAAELPALLGRSTRELAVELGPEYEREVVHRDDLVLIR